MKKFLFIIVVVLSSCNTNIKNKILEALFPENQYQKMGISPFYWETVDGNGNVIPLLEPLLLHKNIAEGQWIFYPESNIFYKTKDSIELRTNYLSPIDSFNISDIYIYGVVREMEYFNKIIPVLYFVYDTKMKHILLFEDRNNFMNFLEENRISKELLVPDVIFEKFRKNPVLPWFPENIKIELEKADEKTNKI